MTSNPRDKLGSELESPDWLSPVGFFSKEESAISLRSATENEKSDFVMPARIAGIQVRKDASGDIRVNLDSSTPCWNDALKRMLLELTEAASPVFSKDQTMDSQLTRRRL